MQYCALWWFWMTSLTQDYDIWPGWSQERGICLRTHCCFVASPFFLWEYFRAMSRSMQGNCRSKEIWVMAWLWKIGNKTFHSRIRIACSLLTHVFLFSCSLRCARLVHFWTITHAWLFPHLWGSLSLRTFQLKFASMWTAVCLLASCSKFRIFWCLLYVCYVAYGRTP